MAGLGFTIISVENDSNDAELLAMTLDEAGVQPIHCHSLVEAQDIPGPHCMLLDLGLDSTDGIDTVKTARHMFPDEPIVVMSAAGDEQLMDECISAGADDFLVKGATSGNGIVRALRFAHERRGRMEAEEALTRREAEAAMAEFQSDVLRALSHELNTPMTPIRLRISLLSNHPDEKVQKAAASLQKNVTRLQRGLRNALSATDTETTSARSMVNVDELLATVSQDYAPVAESKGINLDIRGTAGSLACAEDALEHILHNLLDNAVRQARTHVRIELSPNSVQICNDGQLHPEIQAHLFEPFVNRHVEDTEQETAWGPGLGLHVAHKLCDSMGMKLRHVPSDDVCFHVEFKASE